MRTPTRSCLLVLICLLLPAVPALAGVNLATAPIGRMDLPWWRHRFEATLARIRQGHVDLVWLGDSITQDWERHGPPPWLDFAPAWRHFYSGRHAVNLGFIGDDTASVIWRLDHGEVAGIDPKLVILLIGANNLGLPRWGAGQTIPGIEAVVNNLHRRLPRTDVLLLGILPSIRSAWVSRNTRLINAALARIYADSPFVTYMDVGYLLMKDGRVDPNRFVDPRLHPPQPPLHPTAQVQARIAAAIEPTVARLMGDRNRLLPPPSAVPPSLTVPPTAPPPAAQ